ncbi:hypothetical protein STEG23_004690, partial [Scotinomys teguina]
GEIFNQKHRSASASPTPVMNLPEDSKHMVYFAISDQAFNIASQVYHQAGYLNFSITDDMLPPDSNIRLNTKAFRPFTPQITRRYPDMKLELQGTVVSAPLLHVSPGNLSLAPQMQIEGFVLLPGSARESVFRLGVVANVYVSLTFNNSKVTGMLHPEKAQVKLIDSQVGIFNANLFQAFLNYYLLNTLYPDVNNELAKGFPLPLPRNIQLHDLDLQIHKPGTPGYEMLLPQPPKRQRKLYNPRGSRLNEAPGWTGPALDSLMHRHPKQATLNTVLSICLTCYDHLGSHNRLTSYLGERLELFGDKPDALLCGLLKSTPGPRHSGMCCPLVALDTDLAVRVAQTETPTTGDQQKGLNAAEDTFLTGELSPRPGHTGDNNLAYSFY